MVLTGKGWSTGPAKRKAGLRAAPADRGRDQAASMRDGGLVADGVDRPLDHAAGGLGGDAELLADLAVGALAAVVEAEALLDGEAGPAVEHVEQAGDHAVLLVGEGQLLGAGVGVGEEVDQLGAVVVADRAVERGGGGEAVEAGVLVVELVAVAGHLAQGGAEAGRAVAGEADQAGLLVERPADGLADPEGGVGGELEALAPVELVDGVLEAEVALLDEVEQLHAGGQGVAAGDAHDEAEVGPDEPVLGPGGGAVEAAVLGGGARRSAMRSRAATPRSMIWESSRSSSALSSATAPISLRY